jgi:hypothetical protein
LGIHPAYPGWRAANAEDERGDAERRALFVGLWPPTLWLIGDSVERHQQRKRPPWRWSLSRPVSGMTAN